MSELLKRYTELPYLLYALRKKKLTVMNPGTWEDRNDARFMMRYHQQQQGGSVLALCFALAEETYHHWKVFSHGSNGVCINFDFHSFKDWAAGQAEVKFEAVRYLKLNEFRARKPGIDELPFVKRNAFRDEREWRLIYEAPEPWLETKDIDFDIATISSIVLNPWLPQAVADEIKEAIADIDGCSRMDVFRTTLIDNPEWQAHGGCVIQ